MEITQSHQNESSYNDNETLLSELSCRLEKYLSVQKAAEEEGNPSKVRRYSRIVKQYNDAIKLCKSGRPVPLVELPNPPGFEPLVKNALSPGDISQQLTPDVSPRPSRRMDVSPKPSRRMDVSPQPSRRLDISPKPPEKLDVSSNEFQRASVSPVPPRRSDNNISSKSSDTNEKVIPTSINATIPIIINDVHDSSQPAENLNLLEELTTRLEVYKSVLKAAQEEENSSKARRYLRIIKQYTAAIAQHNAGKPVPLDELPNPPGLPPLIPTKSAPPSPLMERSTTPGNADIPVASKDEEPQTVNINQAPEVNPTLPTKVVTRADKQTTILKERQKEYKNAALAAKKLGQIAEAKEYLKLCKGFDRLIQASEGGLPVDLSTIPVSLSAQKGIEEESFHIVTSRDYTEGNENEVYEMLENELTAQIKSCMNTRNAFKIAGDIANANRFEQYALHFKKDLNSIKVSHANNYPVPKFHYEEKSYSTIQCNNDLTDSDLELLIIEGINYNVAKPNDVDTYVTYEFPYPSENPPSGRTSLVKNTNNPTYNAKFNFTIHREVRACQRIFKRHGIKLEVWSKGGFFHSDTLIGTVVVKLMPLNTEINIHEAFDLMNGRRPAGGKLVVKVRVRQPLFAKKVDTVTEKWLVIDYK